MPRVQHGLYLAAAFNQILSQIQRGRRMDEPGPSSRTRRRTDRDERERNGNNRRIVIDDEADLSQADIDGDAPHILHLSSDEEDDVDEEIQVIKRKRSRVEMEKVEEKEVSPQTQETDGEDCCSICFDTFTSSGVHRLSSLKCGHFFGEQCIIRWLNGEKGRGCPTCKTSAKIKDIRHHFTLSVKAIDNSELESMRQSSIAFQRENEGLRLEIVSLKRQIEDMKRKSMMTIVQQPQLSLNRLMVGGSFVLSRKHSIQLSKEDGSRAFDLNGERVVVSLKLANSPISNDYGILILDQNLRQKGDKVGVSNRRIRSIEFCPFDTGLFFIGGEDQWVMIRSIDGGIKKRIGVPSAVWSSCWIEPHKILLGLSNGRIMEMNTEDMSMNDVIEWDARMGITNISRFDKIFCVLIVSLKSIRIRRHGRLTNHLEDDIRSSTKIQDVSTLSSHNSFVVSYSKPSGSFHKLYRIHVNEDEEVEVIVISELSTSSSSFSYLWRNGLFSFGGSITSIIFQEDFKRILVHDWEGAREDKFLTVSQSKMTQLRMVNSSSQSNSCHILALSERELHLLQLIISK